MVVLGEGAISYERGTPVGMRCQGSGVRVQGLGSRVQGSASWSSRPKPPTSKQAGGPTINRPRFSCSHSSSPQTPNPKPRAPNPKPQTSNPKPQTPSPKPRAPNPNPQISNPNPQTGERSHAKARAVFLLILLEIHNLKPQTTVCDLR